MGIMNWWLGKLNKSGPLAATKPITDNISAGLALVNNGSGPTPQNPGDYSSINVPQLQNPNFADENARKWSEEVKQKAKEGKKNAIAVMNNLAAADQLATETEEYYYGDYREALATNYKRRTTAKSNDMKRLHTVRVHQANTIYKVNQASTSASEAIAQIGQKKKEIAENW